MESSIAKLELADRMLAEAQDLHDISQIRDIAVAAQAYAKAAMLGVETTNKAALVKIKAERKAGEYLKQLDRASYDRGNQHVAKFHSGTQPSDYAQTLEEVQIPKTTAYRWQKMADVPEPVFTEHVEQVTQKKDELTSAGVLRLAKPHVSHNSGNNEWYTPSEYIEAARGVMGGIDLDPASSELANGVVKAGVIYTEEDDGLSKDWHGRVWMNPPYAANLIGQFSSKLAKEYKNGNVDQAIVLVNNATETGWFAALAEVSASVCFLRSRVKFWRPDGDTNSPLQGQAVLYMGTNPALFEKEFSCLGWCARIRRQK